MKQAIMTEEIMVPSGVTFEKKEETILIKSPKRSSEKKFLLNQVHIDHIGNKIILKSENVNKRKKRMLNTFTSHISNMVDAVTHGVVYKLKICSGHFPMNVSLSGDSFIVKNFLGEKVPRTLKIKKGVKVTIDGFIITVEGSDLELVSQAAANIEKLTRRTGFDFNRFQDGIYITDKAGEKQ